MVYLEQTSFSTATEFLKAINNLRLANKGQWVAFQGVVNNYEVKFKSFGLSYLQVLDVNGVRCGGLCDSTATMWKSTILDNLK